MSLPELFRHRDLFVGCLAISRVPRRRAGGMLDTADVAAFDALLSALLHQTASHPDESFSISAQGFDYPSLARCAALDVDGRCRLHATGKPLTCEVVPLDPLVPDSLQHLVLAARQSSASYLGAACIREQEPAGQDAFVADGRIHNVPSARVIGEKRNALALEKDIWGGAVFATLRRELFDSPTALARIPPGGHLTISLAPALLVVAGLSARCRAMCIEYIERQLGLIERMVDLALQRRRLDDRPVTRELRGFSDAYARVKAILGDCPAAVAADATPTEAALRFERQLVESMSA